MGILVEIALQYGIAGIYGGVLSLCAWQTIRLTEKIKNIEERTEKTIERTNDRLRTIDNQIYQANEKLNTLIGQNKGAKQ